MKEWLDNPVSNYRQRIEQDYWCHRCKEHYSRTLHFDNEVGEYSGDESCPLCGHDGILASDRVDEAVDNIIE